MAFRMAPRVFSQRTVLRNKTPSALVANRAIPVPVHAGRLSKNIAARSDDQKASSLSLSSTALTHAHLQTPTDEKDSKEEKSATVKKHASQIKDSLIIEDLKIWLSNASPTVPNIILQENIKKPYDAFLLLSPIFVIAKLYTLSNTQRQRRVCLNYLLHYQHYNADFSTQENKYLIYPQPLCAPQSTSGYTRTEPSHFVELMQPWINQFLTGFYRGSFEVTQDKIKEYIYIGSFSTQLALKKIYAKNCQIEELRYFTENKSESKGTSASSAKKIAIVKLTIDDLSHTIDSLLNTQLAQIKEGGTLEKLKENHPNLLFLFELKNSPIDCTIIGGASWSGCDLFLMPPKESKEGKQDSDFTHLRLYKEEGQLTYYILGTKQILDGTKYPQIVAQFDTPKLKMDEILKYDASKNPEARDACTKLLKETSERRHTHSSLSKSHLLECLKLDDKEFFGKDDFWLLTAAGTSPDRLAVNQFITYHLGEVKDEAKKSDKQQVFEEDLKKIGIVSPVKGWVDFDISGSKEIWRKHIVEISKPKFVEDAERMLYRDAILRWQAKVFTVSPAIEEFASSLLCTQVKPLAAQYANIVHWTKAYQNLCEIVMFCLECFPDEFKNINFRETMLAALNLKEKFLNLHKSVKLYPYGMKVIFDVLHQIMQREEYKTDPPSVAYVTQNYFETSRVIEVLEKEKHISIKKINSLNKLSVINPNILIVDIHTNNPFIDKVIKNTITPKVAGFLRENPTKSLILILDITLNNLSDLDIQEIFSGLNYFIEGNQLEIFCIQSLAKLMQLGGDNFSGGACVYLGLKENKLYDTVSLEVLPHKAAFFGLLIENFKDIITQYYKRIRQNADWMHNKLISRFSDISKKNSIKKSQKIIKFCATKITENVDQNILYVAIRFDPFFDMQKICAKEEKENHIKQFIHILLSCAKLHRLPITNRQSFGFSLSNMSGTPSVIRFSMGVEGSFLLKQYANLITNFSYALSHYVKYSPKFSIEDFEKFILNIFKTLKAGIIEKSVTVPLYEGFDEDDDDPIGEAQISYKNFQLQLVTSRYATQDKKEEVEEVHEFYPKFSYSQLFRLFIQLRLNPKSIYVVDEKIMGFLDVHGFVVLNKKQYYDKESKNLITFTPKFSITCANGSTYADDNVFIQSFPELELGDELIAIGKVQNKSKKHKIFTKLFRFHLKITEYPKNENAILIEFIREKNSTNYSEEIARIFSQEDSFAKLVDYLNSLNFSNLPLTHDQTWRYDADEPRKIIYSILKDYGALLAIDFNTEDLKELQRIKDENCKQAIIKGMVEKLLETSPNKIITLEPKVAIAINQMFLLLEFQRYINRDDLRNLKLRILPFMPSKIAKYTMITGIFVLSLFTLSRILIHNSRAIVNATANSVLKTQNKKSMASSRRAFISAALASSASDTPATLFTGRRAGVGRVVNRTPSVSRIQTPR